LECRGLHYLLASPFRYGSAYPTGSRFRRAGITAGVFYASEAAATAVAEMAFYRLLFFAESPGTPWPANAAELTAFSVSFGTERGLDLTVAPLSADRSIWTHPTHYEPCQDLMGPVYRWGILSRQKRCCERGPDEASGPYNLPSTGPTTGMLPELRIAELCEQYPFHSAPIGLVQPHDKC